MRKAVLKTAALICAAALCGCAGMMKAGARKQPQASSKQAQARQASNPAAQKEAYDRGLKFYTQEKYKEARKAWQEAVRLGPATQTGKKAQEYLEKVEQSIKTLEGIQPQ